MLVAGHLRTTMKPQPQNWINPRFDDNTIKNEYTALFFQAMSKRVSKKWPVETPQGHLLIK